MIQNLEMRRGDTFIFDVQVTGQGAVFDLAGYSATFTAKRSPYDEAPLFQKTSATGGGLTFPMAESTNDIVRVKIAPADTDAVYDEPLLYWDLELEKDGDKHTVITDRLRVKCDITR